MSASYTIDDFTREVSEAVAKYGAAHEVFCQAVSRATRAARTNGLSLEATLPVAIAAVDTLRDQWSGNLQDAMNALLADVRQRKE